MPLRGVDRKIEQMNDDLLSRLRRLGVTKGARNLQQPETGRWRADSNDTRLSGHQLDLSLETLFPGGYLSENQAGKAFIVDHAYPTYYVHGSDRLAELLNFSPATAARYIHDNRLEKSNFQDFVFLDTETTGLAGAGTLAFMVGVGFFEAQHRPEEDSVETGAFVVRQFFLRDHEDEPAMLQFLDELLADKAGLITFNGRTFDLPLLNNRYLMNRLSGQLMEMPHIDLLPPSRRLWKSRLGSCALGSLELNLLGLHRAQEDVPGWLIPTIYFNYLRSGDAREVGRIFYHNRMDMLSMVTLASRIWRHFDRPEEGEALDLLSLGRWQADLGLVDQAESTLRRALQGELPLEYYHQALHRLGLLYKQAGRREEATIVWQQIAFSSMDDVSAHIELAKHFEWHQIDVASALFWTQQALELVDKWPPTIRGQFIKEELRHRLVRLMKKAT
ncbi:MAG: ribonuclease H-like domain-containing protein [Chloroflexota bacterium]